MDVLPAIDLRDGKVVRLRQGDYADQTTYSSDPVSVAKGFVAAGAGWIHMVDLDAAKSGKPTNTEVIRSVCRAVDARVELGGGMRDDATVEAALAGGVARVVIGSAALKDWAWFERLASRSDMKGCVVLGLDARDGKLAAHGWTQATELTALELAVRVKGWPLGAIVYTDIGRDGMLGGVNVEATRRLVQATDVPVIASGGVSGLKDVTDCLAIGCGGIIIGKAYYEGRIDLAEACRLARG